MTGRFTTSRLLALVGLVALAVGPLLALNVHAQAQTPDETSAPSAASVVAAGPYAAVSSRQTLDVQWTVGEMTFKSDYPNGFEFTADIKSSAGAVVRGRVVWSHAPGTQRSRPIEVDPTTGLLHAVWEVGPGESIPPWVGVTYYWDIGDEAGNSFQSELQYAEYEDTGHDWYRTESEDIIVFSESLSEDVNQSVMDAMAEQRETYRQAWGDLLPYKPRAILFGDQDAWEEWRLGASNPHVIGQTSDDWGGTVQVANRGDLLDLAYGTVPHEVGHLYQASFTVMTPGTWFIEGNATFFEMHQMYDYEASVRQLATTGKLPNLLEGTGPGVSGQNARQGYDIGYTWWKWLVDNYGLDGHRQLIQLIDKGTSRNEAIEIVTGMTIEQVEESWRTWLGASPIPPTLVPTPTLLFFPSPTPYTPGKK